MKKQIIKPSDTYICKLKNDCPFYLKEDYTKIEIEFYQDYCLKGGIGCGIKRNNDLTKKFKDTKYFSKDKLSWRSK